MYEDLEPIANLKYGEVVESVSHDMQMRLSEAIASFSSRGLLRSGPMESEKLRIRLEGCERICRSVYDTWLDLITRRSGGRITREDIAFIMTKVENCARLRTRDVRSTSQPGGVTTPKWAAEQAGVKMHAVVANIRQSTAGSRTPVGFLQHGDVGSLPEREHKSGKLQIKRVNFLAADVAQYQRGIIRG